MKPIVFLCSLILICSCHTIKYSEDFKESKKEIDTLIILSSVVDIRSVDENNNVQPSPSWIATNTHLIDSVLLDYLSRHRKLELYHPLGRDITADSIYTFQLKQLVVQLDTMDKDSLHLISLPLSFTEKFGNEGKRYFLVTYMEGLYKTNERIKQENKESLKLALLSLGTFYNVTVTGASVVKHFVVDRKENNIIFYTTSTKGYGYDPRIENVIVENIHSKLKKLYYR